MNKGIEHSPKGPSANASGDGTDEVGILFPGFGSLPIKEVSCGPAPTEEDDPPFELSQAW